MNDLTAALRLAGQWSDQLRGVVADPGDDAGSGERYRGSDLIDESSGAAQAVIQRHADARGLPFGRYAASLVFQRYAHRVCRAAVLSVLASGVLPDLSAASVTTVFADGSPDLLILHSESAWPDASAEGVASVIIDRHLQPMAQVWHSVGRVGVRNLWGNIAAGLAGGARIAAGHIGTDAAREFGQALASARPPLPDLGSYREVTSPGGRTGLFYDRKSCCHWYAVPETGQFCSWCSRLTRDERTERFFASLAD